MCILTMYVYICVQYPRRAKDDSDFPGTRVTDRCKLPCRCWNSNLGPLEELSGSLTSEPLFQSQIYLYV